MTSTLELPTVPTIDNQARAERLTQAGQFWAKHIEADHNNARLNFSVSGSAQGSVATTITAGKHQFIIDEPAGLAGDDLAASPVEYALGALIGCHVVVYRLYAQGLGIQIDSIDAEAEGQLDVRGLFGFDESVRPGFSSIHVNVRVSGPESDERYAELHRAVEAHCPVLDLFANTTPVTTTLTAN